MRRLYFITLLCFLTRINASTLDVNFDNKKRNTNSELNSFCTTDALYDKVQRSQYNNFVNSQNTFTKRYVNLFLNLSGLKDYEILDLEKKITIDFEVVITASDLLFLQDYAQNKIQTSQSNFDRIDEILSDIIKRKNESQSLFKLFSFRESFWNWNIQWTDFHNVILFITVIVLIFYYHRKFNFSYRFIIYVIISFILYEGYKSYKQDMKDAEIEMAIKTTHCDPSKASWYSFVFSYFQEDCLELHKDFHRNPVDRVSLFRHMYEALSLFIIKEPFKIIGSSLKNFIAEITGYLPFPLNYVFYIAASLFSIIAFCKFIFGRLFTRLSFFSFKRKTKGEILYRTGNSASVLQIQPGTTFYTEVDNVPQYRKVKRTPWIKSYQLVERNRINTKAKRLKSKINFIKNG